MYNNNTFSLLPITELLSFIVDNRGKVCPTSETGFPLIATNCIKHTSIYPTFENIRYVSDDTLKNWFRSELKPHDILFVNKGTPGRVCLVPDPVTFCVAQDTIGLRVNNKVYYKYLFAALRSKYVQDKIANFHVGIAIPHFKKSDLGNLLIPIPNMDAQIKIGNIYCDLSEKIENNNRINSELESMAKTIYDYWFLQFEFPNEEGKPYKSSGGKMVWNDELKREIPEGWKVKPLIESIANDKNALVDGPFGTQMKIGEYVDSGVPIYEMEMLNNNYVLDSTIKHYITDAKYEEVKRSTVKNGDIIISKTGTLGLLGIVESEYNKGIIVSRLAKITPDENIIGKYPLFLYLKGLNDSGYWLQHCGGSTMPILNNTIIGNVPILIPNTNLYTEYSKKVDRMFKQIHINQKQNQELASLRDFLLPMLMNGQVTFKDS